MLLDFPSVRYDVSWHKLSEECSLRCREFSRNNLGVGFIAWTIVFLYVSRISSQRRKKKKDKRSSQRSAVCDVYIFCAITQTCCTESHEEGYIRKRRAAEHVTRSAINIAIKTSTNSGANIFAGPSPDPPDFIFYTFWIHRPEMTPFLFLFGNKHIHWIS